jgi:hypothetical protein
VFLHVEDEEIAVAGDQWLIELQQAQREAYIERQRRIKEKGFLRVMRPQLLVSLVLIPLWIYLLKTYW